MSLPHELVLQVLEHVHDHEATLASCSLIHSSWLVASRRHLFRKVEINDGEQCRRLCHVLQTSPVVASQVAHIRLTNIQDAWTSSQVQHIATLLPKLGNLLSLLIARLDWGIFTADSQRELATVSFPHLQDLSLSGCVLPGPSTLLRLLSSAPSLQSFYMAAVRYREPTDLNIAEYVKSIPVPVLKVVGHPELPHSVIRQFASVLRVETLDIPPYLHIDHDLTHAIMEYSGNNLTTLKVYPSPFGTSFPKAKCLTALRSLHLACWLSSNDGVDPLSCLSDFLEQVPSPNLETVSYTFNAAQWALPPKAWDWRRAMSAIQARTWPSAPTTKAPPIVFWVRSSAWTQTPAKALRESIEGEMQDALACGLLNVLGE